MKFTEFQATLIKGRAFVKIFLNKTSNQDHYLLEFKDVEEKSIRNLLDVIEYIKGKPLNEFRIMDLTYIMEIKFFLV